MASERNLHAKEKRRPGLSRTGESVDYPFLLLVLLLLTVGLAMLYSASYAQSEYDTSYGRLVPVRLAAVRREHRAAAERPRHRRGGQRRPALD